MLSLDLTDDELRTEWLRARKLESLCQQQGFPQPQSHYRFVAAACEGEAAHRGITL